MADIDFPASPSLNDTYSFGGKTWIWNGYAWAAVALAGPQGAQGPQGPQGPQGATGPADSGTLTTKGDLLTRTSSALTRLAVGATANHVLVVDSAATEGIKWQGQQETIIVAISDESTNLTTGNAKVTFIMPFAMTLTAVRASLTVASTSGLPTFDINENGSTILSTKITIDANEKNSTTAATPPVISDSSLADAAEITIDIDVAGTGAQGAKIYLIGRRT